ncbi:MAG: AAA family ATPase, partial [Myxococcota bacterium]
RERIRAWRFYDHLRADRDAPARQPRTGTWTPVLSADGADLAAALLTLRRTDAGRGWGELTAAIDDAFPGTTVGVLEEGPFLDVEVTQPGMLRPLRAAELSEGTLRYLMLATALLSAYPPELLVLNEPEASLHTDLVPALAGLVRRAARRSQVMVVTHSRELAEALSELPDMLHHELVKDLGETQVARQGLLDRPSWRWPER